MTEDSEERRMRDDHQEGNEKSSAYLQMQKLLLKTVPELV